jgi:hypothetical protein
METLENKKRYEWVSTGRLGKVETYLADDETNIYFESGRFVQKDQIDILLREIDEQVFQIKNSQQEQQQIQQTPTTDQFAEWEKMLGNPVEITQSAPQPEQIRIEEQNPIKIILDKQRKKETLTILLDVSIEVPNKKVLDLLDVMFDRDEVIEEIVKSSIHKLDQNAITEKVHQSVKEKVLSLFGEEKDDSENEMQTS